MFYVYILQCNDNSLYTGYTVDLDERVRCHNKGKASKYTRARLPVKLVYYEVYHEKTDALKREYEIKQFSRKKKLRLVRLGNSKGVE